MRRENRKYQSEDPGNRRRWDSGANPQCEVDTLQSGSVTFDGNVHFVLDSAFADTGINFDELQNA